MFRLESPQKSSEKTSLHATMSIYINLSSYPANAFWRGGSGFPCLKTPATSAHHNLHTPRVPAGIPRIQTFARCEARLVATGFLWMGLLVPGKKYYTNINWKTWLGTKGRSKNKGWNIFVANVRFASGMISGADVPDLLQKQRNAISCNITL